MKLDLRCSLAMLGLLAARIASGSEPALPAWVSDGSLGMKEGYDNNVFLSDAQVPATFTVPARSVAALKDRAYWISTISPVVGLSFTPLFGDQTNISQLILKYTPDFTIYHDTASESYNAQRLSTAFDGGTGLLTFDASDNFTFIDGNRVGPFYPGGLYSSFATTADRERRRQIQERANVSAQFAWGHFFVRPVASLLDYDLMTDLRNIAGYQNYSDRADVNGGLDFGYLQPGRIGGQPMFVIRDRALNQVPYFDHEGIAPV